MSWLSEAWHYIKKPFKPEVDVYKKIYDINKAGVTDTYHIDHKIGKFIVHSNREAIKHWRAFIPFLFMRGSHGPIGIAPTSAVLPSNTNQSFFSEASNYIDTASQDLADIIGPISHGINSITTLARQINDNLIEPIINPIKTALSTYQQLKTEYHDDLAEGLRGLVKIPGQIAGALTNVDAVLARSNQQLGEQQEHTAESILAPAMQYAGAVPTVASVYHQAYTRMLLAPVYADYPPVDITGPAELGDLKAMLNTAENFILHPQRLKREFLERNNKLLARYRAANKDVAAEFVKEVEADLSEAGDEMIPLVSAFATAIFDVVMAAKGIDIKYKQQEELWDQELRAQTPTELLGIGTLIEAERRGVIENKDRIAQGLLTGLDPSRQQVEWELTTWLIPSALAIDWSARGIIDEVARDTILGWNNVAPGDQPRLIAGSFALANPREMVDTEARRQYAAEGYLPDSLGTAIPADDADQYARTLVTPEAAALDWIAHWKIPPVSWWITAYWRGLHTYSEVRAAAAMENVPPDVLDDLVEVEKETIQQWMLPDIVAAGIVSDEEFTAYGEYIGLDDKSIALLLAWGRSKEKAPVAKAYADLTTVTLTTATTLYEAGTINTPTLNAIYRAHGYSAEAAGLAAEAVDLKMEAAHRKAEVDDLAARADLGILSREQAVSEGYKAGFTDREMERLEATIKSKKLAKTKIPSEASLLKMESAGLLTTPQYVGALEVLGYSTFWARLLAAQELGLTLEDLEAKL